mgnify:CR=1 FL=1
MPETLAEVGIFPVQEVALVKAADTVTELRDVKHAFRAGVRAQKGVDL